MDTGGRSNWFSVALVVVAFFATQLGGVALLKHFVVDGPSGPICDDSHLTVEDLSELSPVTAGSFDLVHEKAQHCSSSEVGTSEAIVTLTYTSDSSTDYTAQAFAAAAESAGWRPLPTTAKGLPPPDAAGKTTIHLRRTFDGHDVRLTTTVFPVATADDQDGRDKAVAALVASGAPTGLTLRLTVSSPSALPAIGSGPIELFKTQDPGIR